MSSKIISPLAKKPTAATASVASLPKASAVGPAPSKVVVKASATSQNAKVVVKAPAKVVVKKASAPKIVYQEEVEEVEDSGSEAQPATAQEIYERIQELLGELVGLSGGRGKIKLTKTGKIRKVRGPRENSEKQSAWMDFVKEVRAEQGVDENGKFLMSHKDAMKLAKELRAEAGEDAGSDHTEEAEEAPVPAKKVVAPSAKKVVAAPAKSSQAKKSPQEIRSEFLARSASNKPGSAASSEFLSKQKAAVAEPEEDGTEVEVEEFEHDGQTYLKNSDNLCWVVDDEGNQTWAGVYLPEEDRIDATVEEPTA